MTTFNEKEKAAENKYAHDQELEFKVHAKRNKLLGVWAATKMGMTGTEGDDYAAATMMADWGHHDDNALVEKVKSDLIGKGMPVSDHDIREALHHATEKARSMVLGL